MALTRDDVLSVIGPADEILVTAIIATEVTTEELAQAWAWVNNDEALINEGRAPPSGRTAELVEILTHKATRKSEPHRGADIHAMPYEPYSREPGCY